MATSEFKRDVHRCFAPLIIIPEDPEADMRQAVRDSMIVDQAVKVLLTGRLDPDSFLDLIEEAITTPGMDDYLDDFSNNLEIVLGI